MGQFFSAGISEVRRSVTGAALPGARLVSLTVFDNEEGPGLDRSALVSHLFSVGQKESQSFEFEFQNAHFGQFIAHDIAVRKYAARLYKTQPGILGEGLFPTSKFLTRYAG
jgi:hypothetical protein